jgi:FixJ family two-component response regulator
MTYSNSRQNSLLRRNKIEKESEKRKDEQNRLLELVDDKQKLLESLAVIFRLVKEDWSSTFKISSQLYYILNQSLQGILNTSVSFSELMGEELQYKESIIKELEKDLKSQKYEVEVKFLPNF